MSASFEASIHFQGSGLSDYIEDKIDEAFRDHDFSEVVSENMPNNSDIASELDISSAVDEAVENSDHIVRLVEEAFEDNNHLADLTQAFDTLSERVHRQHDAMLSFVDALCVQTKTLVETLRPTVHTQAEQRALKVMELMLLLPESEQETVLDLVSVTLIANQPNPRED